MTDFIRRRDVRKEYGLCPDTLDNYGIPRYEPVKGRVVYYRRGDIEDWIAGGEVESSGVTKEAVDAIFKKMDSRAARYEVLDSSKQQKLWEELRGPKSRGSRKKGQNEASKKLVIDESLPSWEKDRIKLKEEQRLAREERKKAKMQFPEED